MKLTNCVIVSFPGSVVDFSDVPSVDLADTKIVNHASLIGRLAEVVLMHSASVVVDVQGAPEPVAVPVEPAPVAEPAPAAPIVEPAAEAPAA